MANKDAKNGAFMLKLSERLPYVLQLTAFEEEFDWILITDGIVAVFCVVWVNAGIRYRTR